MKSVSHLIRLLKVVGNEKEGGGQEGGKWWELASDRGDRGLFALLILLSSLILCISVSAPVKQNE